LRDAFQECAPLLQAEVVGPLELADRVAKIVLHADKIGSNEARKQAALAKQI
jgi:hypothetical protein